MYQKWTTKRGDPFCRHRFNAFYFDLYSDYYEWLTLQDKKIGLVNSGSIKVGAKSVNLRPEPDDQQSTENNLMCILIFYIFSRLVDLLAGRHTSLLHA
jgi:hypothetical protein